MRRSLTPAFLALALATSASAQLVPTQAQTCDHAALASCLRDVEREALDCVQDCDFRHVGNPSAHSQCLRSQCQPINDGAAGVRRFCYSTHCPQS